MLTNCTVQEAKSPVKKISSGAAGFNSGVKGLRDGSNVGRGNEPWEFQGKVTVCSISVTKQIHDSVAAHS
jgi:hypothetical protein